MTIGSETFPQLIKSWRGKCGVSQLELSLRCDVSQKHISFLESARSAPSKAMVLLICEALDVPLRDRNALLLSAGFAPAYQESALTDPELSAVDQALTLMLAQHEPYPALVVDPVFNILRANQGAMRLQTILFGIERPEDLPPIADNVMMALFHPDGYRRYIRNWHDIAPYFLRRLQSDLVGGGGSQPLRDLLRELESYDGVPEDWKTHIPGDWLSPILTVDIEIDALCLSFFSTIATLGTPLDVTLQEIRIESYFPADQATRMFFAST